MLEEPTAGNPHGGVCGGCAGQPAHLPGVTAFLSNLIISFSAKTYLMVFLLQIVFYLLAASYFVFFRKSNKVIQLFKLPYYFLMVNASITVAWWQYLNGERATFWQPSER
jgi:hypothetical protein